VSTHPKAAKTSRLRVLVVEDDLTTLELMREVLRAYDLEVVCESDSEKASERIRNERFDGIFLDLMMPKMSGFELAREIRDDKKTMDDAFRAGGSFFLSKPIDRRSLTNLLKSTRGTMLESRRRLRRVSLRTAVSGNVNGTPIGVQSCDISEQGMLVDSSPALVIGADFQSSFRLPGQISTISAPGLVVRIDDTGRVGLHFKTIQEKDRQRIRSYLDEHHPA
jgi:CheY-like chemotaxis protein